MAVDPVALEGAPVRPDQLAVAALSELLIRVRLVRIASLLLAEPTSARRVIRPIKDLHESDLTDIAQRAELHRLEAQPTVLQTQPFKVALAFLRHSKQLQRSLWVDTYLSAKLCSAYTLVNQGFNLGQLFLILDDHLEHIVLTQRLVAHFLLNSRLVRINIIPILRTAGRLTSSHIYFNCSEKFIYK